MFTYAGLVENVGNDGGGLEAMVFNATFNNISVTVYRGGQFYCWRKLKYPERHAARH